MALPDAYDGRREAVGKTEKANNVFRFPRVCVTPKSSVLGRVSGRVSGNRRRYRGHDETDDDYYARQSLGRGLILNRSYRLRIVRRHHNR